MKNWAVNPVLALYDGEGDAPVNDNNDNSTNRAGDSATNAQTAQQGAKGGQGDKQKLFTQEEVNRFLAEDRRRHQAQIANLEAQYKKALEYQNLSESQRQELQAALESFQAQFRTKEENLKHEYEKLKAESTKTAKMLAEERDAWKSRFETTEIRRAIQDAAIKADAYRPEHILAILQPMTKMVPVLDATGKPTGELAPRVHYPTVDAKTGEPLTAVVTADEAVAMMKQKPEEFGYLFKSNAQGGLGSSSGTGTRPPGKGGKVDVTQLTPAQYRELRKKDPAALGLK